ncbi:unnamed protein product [Rotaria sp. Silwood2]|nr:unnamed protein product [Rotaria sp. Silwood2]CAF3041741.1 unnamed protein product [Rotaria sp. Silwood2]CAF4157166.1 unnamed protein product [Rotaria sp. Silwood2]
MPIPQVDRKRLLKQIDMAEQYQKIRHSGHCSDNADCITHCTTFGLSDPMCAQHRSDCNHAHTSDCPDCANIVLTLDEIGQKIEKITDKDIQREAKFDFENASEHIIEWSRHNLRAARQDAEKKSIISQMDDDEAFCTFDWGQKILPQDHRETQSHLDKTNVPNVSTLRSIRYASKNMNVFKASGIGDGLSIPYKQLNFESNMRVVSPFGNPINDQKPSTIPSQ